MIIYEQENDQEIIKEIKDALARSLREKQNRFKPEKNLKSPYVAKLRKYERDNVKVVNATKREDSSVRLILNVLLNSQ